MPSLGSLPSHVILSIFPFILKGIFTMINPTVAYTVINLVSFLLLILLLKQYRNRPTPHTESDSELPDHQAWTYTEARNAPERLTNGRLTKSSWKV